MIENWLLYANFALNLILLPLLKLLWDVREELVRLNGKIQEHERRLNRIERHEDAA